MSFASDIKSAVQTLQWRMSDVHGFNDPRFGIDALKHALLTFAESVGKAAEKAEEEANKILKEMKKEK